MIQDFLPMTKPPEGHAQLGSIHAQAEYCECLKLGVGFSASPDHWNYYFPDPEDNCFILNLKTREVTVFHPASPTKWIEEANRKWSNAA